MRKYFESYFLAFLLPVLVFGCSTTSSERLNNVDHRVIEISKTTQALEKRLDDLSRSISLIINDGNRLHNEMDDIKSRNDDIQQKIKEIDTIIKNLDEHVCGIEANCKTTGEDLDNRISIIQDAEIELSNRLEMMKLGAKEEVKEKTMSPATP